MSLSPFFQGSARGPRMVTQVEVRHLCFAPDGLAQRSVPVPSSGAGGLATSGGARKHRLGEFGRRGGHHPGGMMVMMVVGFPIKGSMRLVRKKPIHEWLVWFVIFKW